MNDYKIFNNLLLNAQQVDENDDIKVLKVAEQKVKYLKSKAK